MMNERQSWNIITLFLLGIFGFTIATLVHPVSDFSETENRVLAKRPELTTETLFSGKFESDYETFITDQFVGRDFWIGLKTSVERACLRQDINDVYFADDHYLIEKHTNTFENAQAAANQNVLQIFAEQYAETFGADHMTVMIVPNAVDTLESRLPLFAAPYPEETYLQEIEHMLPEGVFFDTSAVLKQHEQDDLYYRTDHHWKTAAAFYVFQNWLSERYGQDISEEDYHIEAVTDSFQGTVAAKVGVTDIEDTIELYTPKKPVSYLLTYNRTDDVRSTVYQDSALDSRDKYAVYYGGNYGLIEAETDVKNGKRLLVLKDSYAHCFVPFTYSYFEQVDMVDLRYYNQNLAELMEEKQYTDILVLYNASGFAEDTSINKMLVSVQKPAES